MNRFNGLGPVVVLALGACSPATEGTIHGLAQVRLFQSSVAAGSVDFAAAGQSIRGVGYGSLTAPLIIPAGSRTIQVYSGTTALASAAVSVADGDRLTMVLTGGGAQFALAAVPDTGVQRTDVGNVRLISAPEVPRAVADSSLQAVTELDAYLTPDMNIAAATPVVRMETQTPSYSTFFYTTPGLVGVTFPRRNTKTVVAFFGFFPVAAGQAKAVAIIRAADGSYHTGVEDITRTP